MAITLVTSVSVGAVGGTNVTTGSVDTSGANLIVIIISQDHASPSVSDNKGNTYTAVRSSLGEFPRGRLYYVAAPTVGSGHTFTCSSAVAGSPSLCVLAFSGAAASPLDQSNGTSTSASTVQAGSITPSENNCVVVIGTASVNNFSSINGGFTNNGNISFSGGNHYAAAISYLIQTTAAAANPTCTMGSSNSVVAQIASFKAAAAAGVVGKSGFPMTQAVRRASFW